MISYVCILVKRVLGYYGHAKTLGGDYNQGEITILYRRAANVTFPPKTKLYAVCLFIFTRLRGVLSTSVVITRRWLLNLQNCSLCSHPGPPSTPICGLAFEDLLPWLRQGSMWRGDVLSYRACLISQLSSQGCAEGQLHNRMIHHVGLTHLSHV